MNRIGTFITAIAFTAACAFPACGIGAWGQQQPQGQQQQRQQQGQHQKSRQQGQAQPPGQQKHRQQGAQAQPPGQQKRQQQGAQAQPRPRIQQQQRSQQQIREQQQLQQRTWNEHRAHQWEMQHRTWKQRGGYNGYHIPDIYYRSHYGPGHWFRVYTLPFMIVTGIPRFQYGGYWFGLVDPFPEYWGPYWYQTDDCYIVWEPDGYYLFNRRYPGRPGIAIIVIL